MICPKCGRPVDENAVICPGCDFILDSGFLGEEVLDEEKDLRPGRGGIEPAVFNLADAVILGDIDDGTSNFETSDTGFHIKESTGARLYVSGRSQALMAPDAIPAVVPGQTPSSFRLTPFERHILNFIDGERPVEAIKRETGLTDVEVKTGLATLADKGVIRVVGRALVEIKPMEKRKERRSGKKDRMRRELVGAVALVGGESDQAIEDAFRTQTAIPVPDFDAPRPNRKPLHRPETDVFHKILDDARPPTGNAARRENTVQPDMRSMTVDRDNASFLDSSEPDSLDRDLQRVIDDDAGGRRTNQIEPGVFSMESDGFDDFGDASQLDLNSRSESDIRPAPAFNRDLSSDLSDTGSAPDLDAPDLNALEMNRDAPGGFTPSGQGPSVRALPLDVEGDELENSGAINLAEHLDSDELDDDDDDGIFEEDTAGALPKDLAKSDPMSFGDEFTAGTVARMNKSAIHRLANSEIDQLSIDSPTPRIVTPEPTRSVMNPLSESLSGLLSDSKASDQDLANAADALSPAVARPAADDVSVENPAPKPLLSHRQSTQVSAFSSLLNESVDNFTDDAYSEIYDDLSSEEGDSDEQPRPSSSFASDSSDGPLPNTSATRPARRQPETTGLHALAKFERERDDNDAPNGGLASLLEPSPVSRGEHSIPSDVDNTPSSVAPDSANDDAAMSDAFGSDEDDENDEGNDVEAPPAVPPPDSRRLGTEAVEMSIDGSLGASDASLESFNEDDVVGKGPGIADGASEADASPNNSFDSEAVLADLKSMDSADLPSAADKSVDDKSIESLLPAPSFEMVDASRREPSAAEAVLDNLSPDASNEGSAAADALFGDDDSLEGFGLSDESDPLDDDNDADDIGDLGDGISGRGPSDAATDPHVSALSSDGASAAGLDERSAEELESDRGSELSDLGDTPSGFEDDSTAAIDAADEINAINGGGTAGLDPSQDSGATAIFEHAGSLLSNADAEGDGNGGRVFDADASEVDADVDDQSEATGITSLSAEALNDDSDEASASDVARHGISLGPSGGDDDKTGAFEIPSGMKDDSSREASSPSVEAKEDSSDFEDDSGEGFEDESTAAIDINSISGIDIQSRGNAAPISSQGAAVDTDGPTDKKAAKPGVDQTHAFDATEARVALGLDSSASADADEDEDVDDDDDDARETRVFDKSSDESSHSGGQDDFSGELARSDPEVTAHLAVNPFDESGDVSAPDDEGEGEIEADPLDPGATNVFDASNLDDGDPPNTDDRSRSNGRKQGGDSTNRRKIVRGSSPSALLASAANEGHITSVGVQTPVGPPPPSSDFMSAEGTLGITDNVQLGNDADLDAIMPNNPATALLDALSDVAAPVIDPDDSGIGDAFRERGQTDGSLVDPPSEEFSVGPSNDAEGKTGIFIPESSLVKRRQGSDPAHRPPALVEASGFGQSGNGLPYDEEPEHTRGADLHSAATGILDDDLEDDLASDIANDPPPRHGTKGKETLASIADLDTAHLGDNDEIPQNMGQNAAGIRPAAPAAANLRAAADRVQRPVEDSGAAPRANRDGEIPADTQNRASFAYSTDASAARPETNPLLDELSNLPDRATPPEEATDYAREQESNSRFESFPDEHTVNIEALSSDESSLPDFNDATAAIEPLNRNALKSKRSDVFATEQLPLPARLASPQTSSVGDAKPRVGNGRGNAAPIGSDANDFYSDEAASGSSALGPATGSGRHRQGTDMQGKAQALFDDAMRDYQAGRVGAARMNAKLAAIYDPGNEEYRHALEQWERAPTGRNRAQVPREVDLYERAQEAESEGDVERALELLREGISVNPEVPAIHNRLGVLLALQKRDYDAAAASIRRAIDLEPDNMHYKNNLGKIVARARSH